MGLEWKSSGTDVSGADFIGTQVGRATDIKTAALSASTYMAEKLGVRTSMYDTSVGEIDVLLAIHTNRCELQRKEVVPHAGDMFLDRYSHGVVAMVQLEWVIKTFEIDKYGELIG